MNDLISRSELKKVLEEKCCGDCRMCDDYCVFENGVHHCRLIDNAPTIPMPDLKEGYKQAIIDGKTNFSRPEFQTESRRGVFIASPIEVVKIGEPLLNSEEINKALEKGEIYKRGFEDARERYERPTGEWILGERNGEGYDYYCSRCMHITNEDINEIRFCSKCGAGMRKGVKKNDTND